MTKYHRIYRKGDGFWMWLRWGIFRPRWTWIDESQVLGGRQAIIVRKNSEEKAILWFHDVDFSIASNNIILIPDVMFKFPIQLQLFIQDRARHAARMTVLSLVPNPTKRTQK